MGGSDSETELKKKKKEKKDKDKDKDKKDKDKDEKKDHGKDKHKDEKEKKDKGKDEKEKKDKGKDEKEKKDKGKDEKKDKHKDEKDKDEKGKDKHKDEKKKDKEKDKGKDKDKKEKDKVDKEKPSHPVHGGEAASFYNPSGLPSQPQPSQPAHPSQSGEVPWFLREPGTEPVQGQPRAVPGFPDPNPHYSSYQQPTRTVGDVGGGQSVHNFPPSGYRIPLDPNIQFPGPDQLGRPPATDFDGLTPVFIGSVIFADSVQPCKIIPSLHPPCRVPHGGSEAGHHGRYDLLPVTQDMEWVPTRDGQIPPGRRPIEGGYESNASKLYHALGLIQGVYIPGKTGQHLRGASVLFGGSEHNLQENYSILCWK